MLPAKIQISLPVRAVWSESSPGTLCIAKRAFRADWSESSLSTFFDSQWSKGCSCGQRRLWSDCAEAEPDLSIRCVYTPEGRRSHVVAHIFDGYVSVRARDYIGHSDTLRQTAVLAAIIRQHQAKRWLRTKCLKCTNSDSSRAFPKSLRAFAFHW